MLSVCAALAYRWDGTRCRLYFATRPGTYETQSLIEFLAALRRHFRGQPVILIWDGLPAHRSRVMQAYLAEQTAWLTVERLPGYAPDLNPVEAVWGNVKGQELANRCAADLGVAATALEAGLTRVGTSRTLAFGFLKHAGLSL